jgi:hypothetical protein
MAPILYHIKIYLPLFDGSLFIFFYKKESGIALSPVFLTFAGCFPEQEFCYFVFKKYGLNRLHKTYCVACLCSQLEHFLFILVVMYIFRYTDT